MNIIKHRPDVSVIVMPLVRLLCTSDLSWANRADISAAIQECQRHWKSMQDEANMLNQQTVGGQQAVGYGQVYGPTQTPG